MNKRPRQIAFYGKGGIGKSTITANLSAVLAQRGHPVLQVGCDPKADSCRLLLHGRRLPSVLGLSKCRSTTALRAKDFVHRGFSGVHCVETGGPEPGVGCAGRGIILAIEIMTRLGVYSAGYDYIAYDVLGDVVCGGFAVPIREGYADEVYLVVSGEFMSLYAANNITRAIQRHARRSATRLAGIIGNLRNTRQEREIIKAFAGALGTQVLAFVPNDPAVQDAERRGRTIIEDRPDSAVGRSLRDLADRIEAKPRVIVPKPLGDRELDDLILKAAGSGS